MQTYELSFIFFLHKWTNVISIFAIQQAAAVAVNIYRNRGLHVFKLKRATVPKKSL